MAGWSEILKELGDSVPMDLPGAPPGMMDLDGVRRRYLRELAEYTGRSVIVYATDFTNPAKGQHTAVSLDDVHGFMEVFKDLEPPNLDLIIHSPGGEVEAAAKLIEYLRHRFTHIRVIVPQIAMSAATILACAADEIVMGAHSQLGPIDPQLVTANGSIPTGAVRRQFEDMRDDIAMHPERLAAYVPTLQQYYPGLLDLCERAERLSVEVVSESLAKYMLADADDPAAEGARVAEALSNSERHLSHSRPLGPEFLEDLGLRIVRLESISELQDRVLSVFHAVQHTLSSTAAAKIIENNNGRTLMRQAVMQVPNVFGFPQMMMPPTLPEPQAPGAPQEPPPEPV